MAVERALRDVRDLPPEQLRTAIHEALDRLSTLDQGEADDEAAPLRYRIAVVGFPLDAGAEAP
ncbi:MAG: hypothetical protein ACOC8L_12840 [Spirochaetota bacterium]